MLILQNSPSGYQMAAIIQWASKIFSQESQDALFLKASLQWGDISVALASAGKDTGGSEAGYYSRAPERLSACLGASAIYPAEF